MIFETLCLGRSKTLSYIWKKYHKNERHLCLVWHSFTKLSQNVSNWYKHFDIYARGDCKLWNGTWFYYISYIIDDHSCHTHIFWYANLSKNSFIYREPSVTCRHIKMCVMVRHTICESLVEIIVCKWGFFLELGQRCRHAQENDLEIKNPSHRGLTRII